MSAKGYDYVGNLLDMVDLTKKADGQQDGAVKEPVPVKQIEKTPPKARSSYKPKKPARAPWADRIPNADADYIIPDEALYPDDDDEPSLD